MKRSRRQRERRRSSYTVGLSRETLYQKTSLCGENLRVRRREEKVGSSEASGREREREEGEGRERKKLDNSLIRERVQESLAVCARCDFMMAVETIVGSKRYPLVRLLAGCIRVTITGTIKSNSVTRLVAWRYSLYLYLCEWQWTIGNAQDRFAESTVFNCNYSSIALSKLSKNALQLQCIAETDCFYNKSE